jgi:hypothetical protein
MYASAAQTPAIDRVDSPPNMATRSPPDPISTRLTNTQADGGGTRPCDKSDSPPRLLTFRRRTSRATGRRSTGERWPTRSAVESTAAPVRLLIRYAEPASTSSPCAISEGRSDGLRGPRGHSARYSDLRREAATGARVAAHSIHRARHSGDPAELAWTRTRGRRPLRCSEMNSTLVWPGEWPALIAATSATGQPTPITGARRRVIAAQTRHEGLRGHPPSATYLEDVDADRSQASVS